MKYLYEAILTPWKHGYEVSFPDLDIVTQGDDLYDAVYMAQDLLQLWISSELAQGRSVPPATTNNQAPEGGQMVFIAVECTEKVPEIETMTVKEAADILGVSNARIYAMARDGILESTKVGNMLLLSTESVRKRYNEPRKAGRPKKVQA